MRLMKKRLTATAALMLLPLLIAALAACEDNDTYPTAPVVVPEAGFVSAATPLPESAWLAMEDFAEQKNVLDDDWDHLQDEFDQWRVGLTDCHGGAVYEALRGFAVESASVTQLTRSLPPSSTTRELADLLIQAAEREEEAYRRLRDRWQPNNLSFFEAVEERRTQSADAQKQVANGIAEMRERVEDAPTQEEVADFSRKFNSLKEQWKDFHDDFKAHIKAVGQLREELPGLRGRVLNLNGQAEQLQLAMAQGSAEAVEGNGGATPEQRVLGSQLNAILQQLMDIRSEVDAGESELEELIDRLSGIPREFEDIADAIDRLPRLEVLESEIEELAGAAVAELSALQGMAGFRSDMTVLPVAQVEVTIERSEALLSGTTEAVKGIEDDDPNEGLADLEDFESAYTALVGRWGDFHEGFNDWRRTEGGCDRTKALQALDGFALDFASLGRRVRDLPQGSHLLPIYNLLTNAIAREEGSMRALRNSWRPFTVDVFKAADVERTNSDRLRRDANIALQGLSERFP